MNINNTKKYNKDNKAFIWFFSFLFLIPYIETSKISKLLTYYNGSDKFVPAIIIIMAIITIMILPLLFIFHKTKTKQTSYYFKSILISRIIFDLIIVIQMLIYNKPLSILFQFIWIAIPFYFAFLVVYVINSLNISICKIHINAIKLFILYLIYNIFLNINKYGFSFGQASAGIKNRLISPGGGPVILGYTIVIMFSLFLFYKNRFKKIEFLLIFLVMIIASLFTGSRGSIWPVIILIAIYLLSEKKFKTIISIMIIGILYINPVIFLNEKLPRFFVLLDQSRLSTSLGSIDIFFKQTIGKILLGEGLGNFYPYQKWTLQGNVGVNYFLKDGKLLLVQPHNSYIYLLIETGVFGLISFIYPLYKACLASIKTKKIINKRYAIFTIGLIILLNAFDSVFIIAPGSSALWWIILLSLPVQLYKDSQYNINLK